MRVCSRVVTLATIALFTIGLRAPALPCLDAAQEAEQQVTAYRAEAPPALSPARHGRSAEAARKAPLVAVLPDLLRLGPTRSDFAAHTPLFGELGTAPHLPRSSRGPPASA